MIYLVVGTRPEALKMAPIVRALRAAGEPYEVLAIYQHKDLLDLALMDIEAEGGALTCCYLEEDTSFSMLYGAALRLLQAAISCDEPKPDLVLVQGDTNTALAGAMAAWHLQIPVGHVEAGLRTNKPHPFPEEGNRKLITQLADLHFCPTRRAQSVLHGSHGKSYVTGNTSIDQLHSALELVPPMPSRFNVYRPWVFVTVHRRENLPHLEIITRQIHKFAEETAGSVVWPVHPNSNAPYRALPYILDNLHMIPPLSHVHAVAAMREADLVVTDSGGVVEEATTLGKRILVLRDETERPEAVESGHASLIPASAYGALAQHMADALLLPTLSPSTVFGEGSAGKQIAELAAAFVRRRKAS